MQTIRSDAASEGDFWPGRASGIWIASAVAFALFVSCVSALVGGDESAHESAHESAREADPAGGGDESGWGLVFEADFGEPDALSALAFSDPSVWGWSDEHGGGALVLQEAGGYAPPHRSPRALALVEGLVLGDFDLELEALQTGREYGHRDLCLFLGFQDPAHFVYVHLATTPDPNAHNIFLVDGAPRRNLLPPGTEGLDWGDDWRTLRVERRVSEGTLRIYVDAQPEPVLALDEHELGVTLPASGRVGVGSFDDSGAFRSLRIWAPDVTRTDEPAFGAADAGGAPGLPPGLSPGGTNGHGGD